jgi:hypothetical protein
MRNTANVVLGSSAKSSVHNKEKLQKQAEAVATGIMIPAGIEFAQFDHAGKKFALSARLVIEVELLESRVPDVVIRQGARMGQRSKR